MLGHSVEVVGINIQAALQSREIETCVDFIYNLPLQPAEICIILIARENSISEYTRSTITGGDRCEAITCCYVVVTQLTPAGTNLQIVDN